MEKETVSKVFVFFVSINSNIVYSKQHNYFQTKAFDASVVDKQKTM